MEKFGHERGTCSGTLEKLGHGWGTFEKLGHGWGTCRGTLEKFGHKGDKFQWGHIEKVGREWGKKFGLDHAGEKNSSLARMGGPHTALDHGVFGQLQQSVLLYSKIRR